MKKDISIVNTERIRVERIKRKFTNKFMAKRLGFKSPTSYNNIENGRTLPDLAVANEICIILEKPFNYFFNVKVQQR